MNDIGKPLFWSLEEHIKAVIGMIRADEIQIALRMCDEVPAWYRENRPKELEDIKKTLYQRLYDAIEYSNDPDEANCTREFGESQWTNGYMHPRAEIITQIIQDDKSLKGIDPWIFDLGCSHGNLLLGLLKITRAFSYKGVGLNFKIIEKVKTWASHHWQDHPIQGQKTILYCTEVIEHCMNPMDIVQSAYKPGIDWDVILLSVPLGCLGGGLPDWDTRRLGHVRGWTKKEFSDFASTHWPGYDWTLYVAPSMVLVGRKHGSGTGFSGEDSKGND